MIENKTDTYRSRIELKFAVDNIADFDRPLSEYFSPAEIVRLMDRPDTDGKFHFVVEIVRVCHSQLIKEQ